MKKIENFTEYFPLGVAKDDAFCNRIKEQEILKRNIESVIHTVIVSPRRYGKSSLAQKVMKASNLPHETVDLFVAKNAKTIERHIFSGIQRLISQIITVPEQAVQLIKTTLKHLDAKVLIGTSGINIEFGLSGEDVASNILEALQALDKILIKKKTKAILFIDEFQQIGALAKARGIEGAIRHVAQETRNISFVFSGSNRHLLAHMFHDSNRPFYKLCHDIYLQRISPDDYVKFLNKISHKAWSESLSNEVLEEIFHCTERHPYYMNVLSQRVWMEQSKPTVKFIRETWRNYVFEERSKTANELDKLTSNQYFLLNSIAHGYHKELTSHAFLSDIKIPSASVIKALVQLERLDYLYKENNEYHLVDPLIKESLLIFSEEKPRGNE